MSRSPVQIRLVEPGEHERVGELTVEAFRRIDEGVVDGGYATELRAVERRAREAVVLVAEMDGQVVGGVTYVPDASSPWAEDLEPGECSIRMLAVDPAAQGHGDGRVLTQVCVDRARREGRSAVFLHSTPGMAAAHAIYVSMGFVRVPDRDWTPVPGVDLLAFRLDLDPAGTVAHRPGGGTGQTRGA